MRRIYALLLVLLYGLFLQAEVSQSEQVQVGLPQMRVAEAPDRASSAEALEQRGDELRASKYYLDAVDFYRAALKKDPNNARIYNKAGIAELQMHHFDEAKQDFEKSIKKDRNYSNSYNNLGVIYYHDKKYSKAISLYEKAIKLTQDSASFYSNLGTAYFAKKQLPEQIPSRIKKNNIRRSYNSPRFLKITRRQPNRQKSGRHVISPQIGNWKSDFGEPSRTAIGNENRPPPNHKMRETQNPRHASLEFPQSHGTMPKLR